MESLAVMTCVPDEDLVLRWRRGEEDAFSQLYRRYRKPVMSTAYRIIGNSADAQDATQEIFVKVYRSLTLWDPAKSRLSTWLFRLASNHAIDRWRIQRRRSRFETASGFSDVTTCRFLHSGAVIGPHTQLMRKELASRIHRTIRSLPRLQRRFFVLRYLHGLRLQEIAHLEGRSLGTVKGLLFRACRTVRHRLGHS